MPVTLKTAGHGAYRVVNIDTESKTDSGRVVLQTGRRSSGGPQEFLQSSFKGAPPGTLIPDRNAFVQAVTQAYNEHHHLAFRPDDVWIAIITQFSSYVNAHAEDLRASFVAQQGRKISGLKW